MIQQPVFSYTPELAIHAWGESPEATDFPERLPSLVEKYRPIIPQTWLRSLKPQFATLRRSRTSFTINVTLSVAVAATSQGQAKARVDELLGDLAQYVIHLPNVERVN